jgi:cell division protein FtsB
VAYRLSQILKPYWPSLVILIVIIYGLGQLLMGDRGLLVQDQRTRALKAKAAELTQLTAQRRDLSARARFLRSDHLSKDLLEERARQVLGFSAPNQYVIRAQAAPNRRS